uniref:Uncharacterized protein n=1 Tax=Myoviridae sp. ctCo31 TaxID=2825053 RepID=A0A8S5UMJ4_9CAUD|nr:MAG TPA: hypothetical protein [Myoviridae sp. ctCo31]
MDYFHDFYLLRFDQLNLQCQVLLLRSHQHVQLLSKNPIHTIYYLQDTLIELKYLDHYLVIRIY